MTTPGISQSMINAAQSCERKYKYVYIDKLKPELGSGAMEFGTALHMAINSILEGDDDALDVFHLYWDTLKDVPLKYFRNDWEAYAKLGPIYISRFGKLHAKKYKPFMVETRLKSTYEDVIFEGTPDFVGDFSGVPSLLDFKTASKPYDNLKLKMSLQLYLYSWLVMETMGYEVKQIGYVVFVSHPEPRIQVITAELNPETMSKVLESCVKWGRRINSIHTIGDTTQVPMNATACLEPYKCDFISKCWG